MPLCNNQVVQHGFSSFLVIHRKRECAVFSGERNASARCLPAYNSCSSSRVTSTRRPGLFARGTASDWLRELVAPPTTSVYWTELGRKKPRPLGFPPRACHCRVRPVRNTKSARAVSSTVHMKNIAQESTPFVFFQRGTLQS